MIFKNGMFFRVLTGLLLVCTITSPSVAGDFPNYFEEIVGKARVGRPRVTQTVETQIEKCLHFILEKLEIPWVDSDGNIQTEGFFKELTKRVKERDPAAEPFVSGGVVRSLLGYIYSEIHKSKMETPGNNLQQIFDEIERRPKFLPSEVLGVGSDLDILVHSPTGNEEQAIAAAKEFIKASHGLIEDLPKSQQHILNLPKSDVQSYSKQTEEATKQGGSTLDWLAFPTTGTGRMKTPEKRGKDAFREFILGRYQYLEPEKPDDPGEKIQVDYYKQAMRGLRPLIEIPFLDMPDGLKKELKRLKDLKSGLSDSEKMKVQIQFKKAFKNARFGGAKNRLLPRKKVRAFVELFSPEIPAMPEFLDHTLLNSSDPCGLQAKQLLTDSQEFIKNFTRNGVLYHGTQSENVLPILRGGFVISKGTEGFGNAIHGPGFYTTKDIDVAKDYSKREGTVIHLRVTEDPQLKVVNLLGLPATRTAACGKIKDLGTCINYLKDVCKVDIVLNTHVIIQNSAAVTIVSPQSQPFVESIQHAIRFGLKSSDVDQKVHAMRLAGQIGFSHPDIQGELVRELENSDPKIHDAAFFALSKKPSSIPDDTFYRILNSRDVGIKRNAVRLVQKLEPRKSSAFLTVLKSNISSSDLELRHLSVRAVLTQVPSDETALDALTHFFAEGISSSDKLLAALSFLEDGPHSPLLPFEATALDFLLKANLADPSIAPVMLLNAVHTLNRYGKLENNDTIPNLWGWLEYLSAPTRSEPGCETQTLSTIASLLRTTEDILQRVLADRTRKITEVRESQAKRQAEIARRRRLEEMSRRAGQPMRLGDSDLPQENGPSVEDLEAEIYYTIAQGLRTSGRISEGLKKRADLVARELTSKATRTQRFKRFLETHGPLSRVVQ